MEKLLLYLNNFCRISISNSNWKCNLPRHPHVRPLVGWSDGLSVRVKKKPYTLSWQNILFNNDTFTKKQRTGEHNLHFRADLCSISYVGMSLMTTSDQTLDMQMSAANRMTTSSKGDIVTTASSIIFVVICNLLMTTHS